MRSFTFLFLVAAAPALALAAEGEPAAPPPQLSAPPPPPSVEAPPEPAPAQRGTPVRITLKSGRRVSGELISEANDAVVIRVGENAPVRISRASIRVIDALEPPHDPSSWFRDLNVTRLLYSPTAFRLRQGEGYLSQKELVISTFGYGITDHVSIVAGSALPLWLGNGGQNVLLGIKVGFDANELVHVAAGAQGVLFPFATPLFGSPALAVGGVHGTVSVGTPEVNLTASGVLAASTVPTFPTGAERSQFTPMLVLGGSYRIHRHIVIQTEHWMLPQIRTNVIGNEPFMMFNSAGIRLMNEHMAADLGVVRFPGTLVPLPWVDFTVTFGG